MPYRLLSILLFTLTLLLKDGIAQIDRDGLLINNFLQLRDNFIDPPSAYRSAPLWDWNDSITKEGIDFQMQEFKKAGIGGVFVHPRPGLVTEYLSDEWFQLFDYTVQKAKELDMKVWIYDENSYPSGFAGGHVPAEMPESYQDGTGLKIEIQKNLNITPSDTVEVVLKKTKDRFLDITSQIKNEIGMNGIYYIFRKTFTAKSPWYGGWPYVDLIHKGVTEKFIDLTFRNGYEKRNKLDFGKTILGNFSDEPNLEAAMSSGSILRWTPDLWEIFKKRWGYDLKVNLPSLVEEIGDWQKVRHDYYETLLELFVDRWAKPISKYCEQNNLIWTGHYWEHGWPFPTHGFDESAIYAWMQMPGIDMLGNQLIKNGQGGQFGNTRAVRELRSVANQTGRRRTLSETYGGGGWAIDFKTLKKLVDWEVVLGVNFVNQHLSFYTIKGVRKFDYPQSFSYHEPWWNDYRKLGDYIGRISLAMSAGEQINSTLVLQPNTTAWMYFSRTHDHSKLTSIQHDFKGFVDKLEKNFVEYDLGSENVLKHLGSVKKGNLIVGKRAYDLVVIPKNMENIDLITFKLLKSYLKSGGKVLSFRKHIKRIDGLKSDKGDELQQRYPNQWIVTDSINESETLDLLVPNKNFVRKKDNSGDLYFQRRVLEDGQLLFFVNSDKHEDVMAEVSVQGSNVIKMNLEDGQINKVPFKKKNGKIFFNLSLNPIGSALYFIAKKRFYNLKQDNVKTNWEAVRPKGETKINTNTKNILVLNYLDLITSKDTMEDAYFMQALTTLYKESGIEMGDPWRHKIQYKKQFISLNHFPDNSDFTLNYHFYVSKDADISEFLKTQLIAERSELWAVSINGHAVQSIPHSYWIDKDFPKYNIGKYLKPGKNTVSLNAPKMSIFAEIMPIYILGDFKLSPRKKGFEIISGKLNQFGSWKDLGYIFYSDKVLYSQRYNIKKGQSNFKVKLTNWKGTVAEIFVNGQKAGTIAWAPNELDITKYLKNGENKVAVRVVGSLKNTFGPFYLKENRSIYGPFAWDKAPKHQPNYEKYFLKDYGLFEPFELLRSE